MNKLFFLLWGMLAFMACNNEATSEGSKGIVRSVSILNVGEFVITDSSLAVGIGSSDTVSESTLTSFQLGKLIPFQFDSFITVQNLKNYSSYEQIINELVARGRLESLSIVGDTTVPRPGFEKIALFEKVSTEKLLQTRGLIHTLEKAIYNDRSFPMEDVHDSAKKTNAGNVLYMISKGRLPSTILSRKTSTIALSSKLAVHTRFKICEGAKRWRHDNDIVFAECTAFAISDDLVVTAGHCLNQNNFGNYCFMFGFSEDPGISITIDSADIYLPVEFIDGFSDLEKGIDYALVRVSKKIPKDKIFTCSNDATVTGDNFYMVGHPLGTYTKISLDGTLFDNSNANYFVLSIDAFAGNSGSPVLNERENKVKGILISGNADVIGDEMCKEFVFCGQNAHCSGESVFRIVNLFNRPKIKAYLEQHPL